MISRGLAKGLAIWALAMEVASLVLIVPNVSTSGFEQIGFNGAGGVVLGATYPIIGWLLASRRPDNAIGWTFLVIGVSQAGTAFMTQYAVYGLITNPGALPFADVASWIGVWSWVPGFVLLFVMVLVFPDGQLPSPRWRPALWLAAVAAVLMGIPGAFVAWGLRGEALLTDSPIVPDSLPMTIYIVASGIGNLLMVPLGLVSVAAILVRFRRSHGIEREQIKWFTAAAVVEVAFLIVSETGYVTLTYPLDFVSAILVVPLVPIAVGIAVLRYHLYEIDRIISRTLGWAIVTGLLVAVFAGTVVLLETVLAPVVESSTLAVAASTLVAFALFQPLRRRVQRTVDRRFDRARYDAQRTSEAFARRLRTETDITTVLSRSSSPMDTCHRRAIAASCG